MPERRRPLDGLTRLYRRSRETAYLMIGIPDYARYVAHRQARHPGEEVMTWPEFVRERAARRFGDDGPGRCC